MEACDLANSDVSPLLQQLLEVTAFPLLVEGHCLTTVGALGGSQQPLEQRSPVLTLPLRHLSDSGLPHAQQESIERRL